MMDFDSLAFAQWPKDRERPTEEQMNEAKKRLDAETRAAYARGYDGDYGMSLAFTMGTYNREVWWHLFFPDEKFVLTSDGWKQDGAPEFELRGRGF